MRLTSHKFNGWLNKMHPENSSDKLVKLLLNTQEFKGWLKLTQFWNIPAKFVTKLISQAIMS